MIKNNKKTYILFIVLLSATLFIFRDVEDSPFHSRLLSVALDPTKVSTTSTRTSTVGEFCKVAKTELISAQDITTNANYFSIMKTYFKADITSMIGEALNGNMANVFDKIKEQASSLGIYVAPFVIGLLLSLTLWAFLCCCCTCTSCCPSKCCQHDENILYTKCELLWPAIVLVILLALAIGASIPGITQASKLSDSITTMQCGIGLMLDDLLNGNLTADSTSFFSGTNTLVTLLGQLKSNVNDINTQFTNVQSSVGNVRTTAGTIRTNIETLGLAGANQSLTLQYSDPTPGGTYTADSYFSTVLGNPTVADTLSSGLYSVFNTLYYEMDTIYSSIGTFSAAMAGSGIETQINKTIEQFEPINTQIGDIDTMVYNMFATAGPILGYLKLGVLVFFAVSISLAAIIALGAIFTAFCEMPKCRFLMYVFCIITVVIIVLGFLITTVFAIMSPVLYMGCTVLNSALDSQAGFNTFTVDVGLGSNNVTSILSVCLTGGNGQILEALGVAQIDSLNSNLGNMSTVMSGFSEYANYDTSALTTGADNVSTKIGDFASGKINDIFTSATALNYFTKLADRSQYPGCTDSSFALDSLVPSTDSQSTSFVACSKTNIVTCGSGDYFNTIANGCIDLTSCFPNYANSANVKAHFLLRYPDPTCTSIADDMATVFDNWDLKRRDASTGISAVESKYNTDVKGEVNTNLIPEIGTLKTKCSDAISHIESTADKLTNPSYGLIAGLNCRVIGEDLVIAKNTVCVSFFNSMYFLLLTVGITSFAFLFGICCVTCTGVRHYKQEQTKIKIGTNYDGGAGNFYEQTAMNLNQNGNSGVGYPGGGYSSAGGYPQGKNHYP